MSHANARLTPRGRLILIERIAGGWPIVTAAVAAGVSRQTGSKWWGRYRREGASGLVDRRSVVHRQARAHHAHTVDEMCRLRRELRVGPHRLAWQTGISRSTIYTILRRRQLARLSRLEPRPAVTRYERAVPGELVHLDTKALGRIRPGGGLPKPQRAAGYGRGRRRAIGWDRIHVAVDDYSRLAYVEELSDEAPATTAGFLERAVAFYAGHGITVQRVLSDNGGCYRSRLFAAAAERLGVALRKTRPYRPQTNGASEFIALFAVVRRFDAAGGWLRLTVPHPEVLARFASAPAQPQRSGPGVA